LVERQVDWSDLQATFDPEFVTRAMLIVSLERRRRKQRPRYDETCKSCHASSDSEKVRSSHDLAS
jgi:hypothetical protein